MALNTLNISVRCVNTFSAVSRCPNATLACLSFVHTSICSDDCLHSFLNKTYTKFSLKIFLFPRFDNALNFKKNKIIVPLTILIEYEIPRVEFFRTKYPGAKYHWGETPGTNRRRLNARNDAHDAKFYRLCILITYG